MPTLPMLLGEHAHDIDCEPDGSQHPHHWPEAYPGENRDYNQMLRMQRLNEQLRIVHKMKLPLCGGCLEFHSSDLTCVEVEELMFIDETMLRNAIG